MYNPKIIVIIPPDLESKLILAAQQHGVSPQAFALERVRAALAEPTLLDAWQGFIGVVEGTGEAFSENTSDRFSEAMLEKKRVGRL